MVEAARQIAEVEGRAVFVGSICGGLSEGLFKMRGFEDGYMDLAAEPGRARQVMERILEIKLAYWDRVLRELGDLVDVVGEADDLGGQDRTLFSPATYRSIVKPLQRELFSFIRARTSARIFLHSCGAIRELIPDLIEIGVDILNPVQVSATGMDGAELKREFGRDLDVLGRRRRHPARAGRRERPTRSATRSCGASTTCARAAGSCSPPSTTSSPTCPPRTSSPCGPRSGRPTVREVVEGRLVLADDVVPGRLVVEDGWIADVVTDPGNAAWAAGPLLAPGLIDVHVHGWGGHDGTGDAEALSGMARALLRQGITSFLPTAPSLPEPEIPRFAARVRDWMPSAPADGAEPLGFNLEGPFIAPARKGAHDPALLRTPENIDPAVVDASLDGLRIMTIAPELPGALALIERLAGARDRPVHRPLRGHPGRGPGRLPRRRDRHPEDDDPPVQRDDRRGPPPPRSRGRGAHGRRRVRRAGRGRVPRPPALWPIILRSKPAGRLILVSDAMSLAGLWRRTGTDRGPGRGGRRTAG